MKSSSIAGAIAMLCLASCIYLILLSVTMDASLLKMQIMALGTSFFVAGIVLAAIGMICWAAGELFQSSD